MGGKLDRPYTKIQGKRVLREIIGRRRLSLQELAIASFIWAHSWGFNRATTEFTPRIKGEGGIAEWTGIHSRNVRRVLGQMIERLVVIRHENGALEFNEHFEDWRGYNLPPVEGVQSTPLNVSDLPPERAEFTPPSPYSSKVSSKEKGGGAPKKPRETCPVWDLHVKLYLKETGRNPTRETRFFPNIARLEKAHDRETVLKTLRLYHVWQPGWWEGHHDFDRFIRHFDRVLSNEKREAPVVSSPPLGGYVEEQDWYRKGSPNG